MEVISVEAKKDGGWNTFAGSSIPRYSGANNAGNSFDVIDSMAVVILVTPAIASTNEYTNLEVGMICLADCREFAEELNVCARVLARMKEIICCKTSTEMGKTSHTAINVCFRS